MNKKNELKILHICKSMSNFCHNASTTIAPPSQMHTEAMQKTSEGLSRIFSSLEKDFEMIANLVKKNA